MKPAWFGLSGVVLQGGGLVAFILVSRTGWAAVGKPVVMGATLFSVTLLLWYGVKQVKTLSTMILLPTLLAFGFTIALHAVWALGFHGLLHDMEFSAGYLISVLRGTAILFLLYVVGTVFLYFISKVWQGRTR